MLPYRGQLYLDGVKTITEDVAKIIASRRNGVELYGVENINYRSVAMLRKNSEIILPASSIAGLVAILAKVGGGFPSPTIHTKLTVVIQLICYGV